MKEIKNKKSPLKIFFFFFSVSSRHPFQFQLNCTKIYLIFSFYKNFDYEIFNKKKEETTRIYLPEPLY